jgi:O-antigen/teichoic acid export membrane protein
MKKNLLTRGLSALDQALVSLANAALAIGLARVFSAEEFAGYGIGISAALIIQSIQRSGFVIPLSLLPTPKVRVMARAILAEHLILLIAALVPVLIGVIIFESMGFATRLSHAVGLSFVACLLFFFQLDFDRVVLLKAGRIVQSALWSLAYAALCAGLLALALYGLISFDRLIVALIIFQLVKLCALAAMTGAPMMRLGWRLLKRDMQHYFGWATLGAISYSGYSHVPLFVLGAVAAPIHAAAFVAMRSLMQPLQVVVRSLDLIDKHVLGAAGAQEGVAGERRVFRRTLLVYTLLGLGFAVPICFFAKPLVALVYGAKYQGFEPGLYAWAVVFVFLVVTSPLESMVYARKKVGAYFLWRSVAGVIATISAYPLCLTYGYLGAILACVLGWVIAFIGNLWLVRAELKRVE